MSEEFGTGEIRLLVTGAAGFIGSSFVRTTLAAGTGARILVLDKLTYAGNLANLKSVEDHSGYRFFKGDICEREEVLAAFDYAEKEFGGQIDAVVHFAAETHVDRSIVDAAPFLRTNVLGTEVMLWAARRRGVRRFVNVSTDEVYGTLGAVGAFTEYTPLAPNNPYSASKAGADLIVRAYYETHGFPVLTTRCSNNFGPYQFPEKLIPLIVANALEGKSLPIYGDGLNIRDWIYVDDHSRGVEAVLRRGVPGSVYNLGGYSERTNLHVVKTILELLDKPESLIRFVEDRPGHDRRYSMDATKAKQELDWSPSVSFEDGLKRTVSWYLDNPEWIAEVRSGEYETYYQRMYDQRAEWLRTRAGVGKP